MKLVLRLLSTFFPLFCCMNIQQLYSIPISLESGLEDLEADSIISGDEQLVFTGNVKARYAMGVMRCDRAVVILDSHKKKKEEKESSQEKKIDLYGNVKIIGIDKSILEADRGEILYADKKAVFYGSPSQKVIYTTFQENEGKLIPVVISGNKMVAKIIHNEEGKPSFTDIRGEGAVTIDYPISSIEDTRS